jgi:DnaJ domain
MQGTIMNNENNSLAQAELSSELNTSESASYYELLGITNDCDAETIELAWRSIRSNLHPDKGGDAELFARVKLAYEVLSDPAKRKQYDTSGPAGVMKDSSELEIANVVANLLSSVLSNLSSDRDVDAVDLIGELDNVHSGCVQNSGVIIARAEQQIKQMRKAIKKLAAKGALGNNIVEQVVADKTKQIATLEQSIKPHRQTVHDSKAVKAAIAELKWEFTEQPLGPYSRNIFYNH